MDTWEKGKTIFKELISDRYETAVFEIFEVQIKFRFSLVFLTILGGNKLQT